MEANKHHSSVQVMFSDKGSTLLGILLVTLMVALSLTFFILKFQKKPTSYTPTKKVQKIFLKTKTLKNSRILFYPLHSKHFLLFHYPKGFTYNKTKKTQLLDQNNY